MAQIIEFEAKQQEAETEAKVKEIIDTAQTPFKLLLDEAHNIQARCVDYDVKKANDTKIRLDEFGRVVFVSEDDNVHNLGITPYALSQFCSKIGVPYRYIDKCISTGRYHLAKDNIDSWLTDFNKDLFIREYNGDIRGMLSNKYSVCDTPYVLESIANVMDTDNLIVKGSFISPERMHVRMVDKEMLNIQGEDLFTGVVIDSSDVGRSILQVKFLLYKQVCTNGLIIAKSGGTLFSQKHIGISADEFMTGLENSLKLIPQLREQTIARVNELGSKAIVSMNIEDEVEALKEKTKLTFKLSDESVNKVIDFMKEKYSNTKWGYINALTEVAQDFTLERRLEIESIAGNLFIA